MDFRPPYGVFSLGLAASLLTNGTPSCSARANQQMPCEQVLPITPYGESDRLLAGGILTKEGNVRDLVDTDSVLLRSGNYEGPFL